MVDFATVAYTPQAFFETSRQVGQVLLESDKIRPQKPGTQPYPFADVISKAALSTQLFKDPECWSSQGSNPRPPVL